MTNLEKLLQTRNSKYFSLVCLKYDIQDYIKNPLETVSIESLKCQYSFIVREISDLDFRIKNHILLQIQNAKLDLKNLENELSLIPNPFDVNELPSYQSIFKN